MNPAYESSFELKVTSPRTIFGPQQFQYASRQEISHIFVNAFLSKEKLDDNKQSHENDKIPIIETELVEADKCISAIIWLQILSFSSDPIPCQMHINGSLKQGHH